EFLIAQPKWALRRGHAPPIIWFPLQGSRMALRWTRTNDWHIARFRDGSVEDWEQDAKAIKAFVESLPPVSKVAISFRGVEFISSGVIGLILAAKAKVAVNGGKFAITSPSDKVIQALKIAQLDKVLTIKQTTNDLV